MTLQTVQSAAIHAVGYDRITATMEIIFTGGGIYIFHNVPMSVYAGLMAAASKGGYFQNYVKGRFAHDRLGRFRPRRAALQVLRQRDGTSGRGAAL